MAAKTRAAPDHLNFLRAAASEVHRFGFFALMRGAEARAPQLPRIGLSRHPREDIAQLAHTPSLDFPAATLDAIKPAKGGRLRVRGYFLGLGGPMGPLPLHMTEYAAYERRYAKATPFGGFLDLITNRMLQFFYRAWADSQPTAHADRPSDDRFAGYLAAISGACDGAGANKAFTGPARLRYAGLFASRRSAAALQDAVSHALGAPVRIQEFIGRWRDIAGFEQTQLVAQQGFAELGAGAVLGGRVRVADDTFRLTVRVADQQAFNALLPGGDRFKLAAEVISAFAPCHVDWELELEIEEKQISPFVLGQGARLGWTSWLNPGQGCKPRADTRLRRTSHCST